MKRFPLNEKLTQGTMQKYDLGNSYCKRFSINISLESTQKPLKVCLVTLNGCCCKYFNYLLHQTTRLRINTYLLGARETVCFLIPRPGDVSRGAAEGNIGGRGITKHTAFPRAQ